MTDLKQFLDGLGLGQHFETLSRNDVDLEILADLSDQDLAQLGLSLGHRRKLMAAVRDLAAAPAPAAEPAREPHAERRQVTVLFSDLVGSTELSRRLDPEDLARLMRQYQDACAGVIARFDGFLAKFMGDGVLAYFGYPQAHEDSAERAARAGLEIVAAVRRIGDGTLASRIGIATGLVVVGEIIGSGAAQEQTIVGDTPNLAARLQAIAEPHAVLIAGVTRRLLGDLFDYEFLGERALKGIAEPFGIWRVVRENENQSRFQAVREAGPLVGREQEIALLAERWRLARAGEGQAVLLCGEAGIGKSRLVEALVDRTHDDRRILVRMQCSPYHSNTALYPVTRHIGETASFTPADSVERRREKLRSTLGAATKLPERAFRVLTAVMGLAEEDAADPHELTAAQQKAEVMKVLAERLLALAVPAPVLLLLEDAHWIDPTTRELFDALVDRLENAAIMIVVTHRPEFTPTWTGRPFVTALAFNRLSGRDCAAIVANLTARAALSHELVAEILRRGDGVPLFVEELTKAVLEAGADRSSVPPTLQDSLMARLDRLGRVKDIAQVAAVIGREFARPLLAAVVGIGANDLDDALARLVDAGLVFPRGNRDEGRFSFKHALLQEAAYESLLRTRRQTLHAAIGRALEASGTTTAEPEIAAHHFERAGLHAEASRFWERAGDKAVAQSSYAEAIANYGAALDNARRLEPGTARDARILALQLKIGPTRVVIKGYGDGESAVIFNEAHALAQALGDRSAAFKAAWGLWINDIAHRRFDSAAACADELIDVGRSLNDDGLSLEAVHCRWSTAFHRGEMTLARDLTAEGVARYDPARHHRLTYEFGGHDPGVCARGVQAVALCLAGFPDQGIAAGEAGIALADSLGHPNSLAHGLLQVLLPFQAMGDHERCAQAAERLLAISQKFALAPGRMTGELMAGWVEVRRGDIANGLTLMEAAFARHMLMVNLEFYFHALMAETYGRAGRPRDGLALVDASLGGASNSQLGFYLPELWRLKGDLMLAVSAEARAEACAALENAMAIAERQGARLLQLRAATSLARVRAETGGRDGALALLQPLYASFTEGFDSPDLAAAARLLVTLA